MRRVARTAPGLLHLVECLGRLLHGSLRASGGEVGLQLVHLQALAYLRRANRYSNTPRALADFLGLTKGTVSQSLLLLHRRGLVEREEDPADGRVVRLRLSARGRRLLAGAEKQADWERALAAVPAGERASAGRALHRLLAALQQQRSHLSFGECRTCAHFRTEGSGTYRCGLTGEPLKRAETLQICREHRWAGDPG
jgi:DNA-binding MarR family transcriptional regulator